MYLIDGYNLLHQTEIDTREELVSRIDRFCASRNKHATIVFDGYSPDDLSTWSVEVRFGGDADELLKKIINETANPSEIVLVSSDNDVRFSARARGMRVIKSEDFMFKTDSTATFDDDAKPNLRLSDEEVEKWARAMRTKNG